MHLSTAILARYKPLNSLVRIEFDSVSGLLHSMQIDGRKNDLPGTHRHEYSQYATRCGVQMPTHNVKSFNGDIWVEEDILSLQCENVEEAFFMPPAQVTTGTLLVRMAEQRTLSCVQIPDAAAKMCFTPGGWGPAETDAAVAQSLPASLVVSLYRVADVATNLPAEELGMLAHARSLALQRTGPMRLIKHDQDGMGLTGEVIYELQLPVAPKVN